MTDTAKKAVQNFRDHAVCGEDLYLEGPAPEAYDRQSPIRYQLELYIQPFANFSAWKDKSMLEIGVGLGADHEQFAVSGAVVTGVDLPKLVDR